MLPSISLRRTRRGNVIKVVKENYLRDDIVCGSSLCSTCSEMLARVSSNLPPTVSVSIGTLPLEKDTQIEYIIPDLTVFLNQMDFMEHASVKNVIVLQSVLQELRSQNMHFYARLRELIANVNKKFFVFSNIHHRETHIEKLADESTLEFVNRSVSVVARWYALHFAASESKRLRKRRPLVVVNDERRATALQGDSLRVDTIATYAAALVTQCGATELLDIVVPPSMDDDDDDHNTDKKGVDTDALLFPAHLSPSAIEAAIRDADDDVVQGKLRMNRNNRLEGSVRPFGAAGGTGRMGDDDVFVVSGVLVRGEAALNRATDGDIVAVRILPRDQWLSESHVLLDHDDDAVDDQAKLEANNDDANPEADDEQTTLAPRLDTQETNAAGVGGIVLPTGVVVGIVRRAWKPLCGALLPSLLRTGQAGTSATSALFAPADRRLPRVRIRTRQAAALRGQRIVVAIDRWPRSSRYPLGHYVRTLGPLGDAQTETEALLLQHDIPHHPFSAKVLACLPPSPWSLAVEDQEQLKRRVDLRSIRIASVDPPGCTDIDDALHCRRLPNGRWEVGVHIADVTHYVKPGTALDNEAADRSTSVYLVDKRIDMLPPALSTDTCSLRPNVDRLAFSCVWEMDDNANIVATRFHKSIIKTHAALTYEEAQLRIDAAASGDELAQDLSQLNRFAKRLRAARLERGALTLASTQVRFVRGAGADMAAEGAITDVALYETRDTNSMVEEFMLLANVSVAEHLLRAYPQFALLRRHPEPLEGAFDSLSTAANAHGVTINANSSLSLAKSLDAAHVSSNPFFNKMLRILATRSMNQAVYFCAGTLSAEQFRHYGLAANLYTHFTSPIRRYADVVVHRLLAASIGWEPLSKLVTKARVTAVANHINERGRQAQQASRDSTQLFTLRFFRNKQVFGDAYITGVKANGFTALVPRYGVEGIVHLAPRGEAVGAQYVFSPVEQTLTCTALSPPRTLRVFDPVCVAISVDDSRPHDPQLRLVSVDPPIGPGTDSDIQAAFAAHRLSNTSVSDKSKLISSDKRVVKKSTNKRNTDNDRKQRKKKRKTQKKTNNPTTTTLSTIDANAISVADVPVTILDDEELGDVNFQ